MTVDTHTVPVDPSRLASGRWDHHRQAQIGEGDIVSSYSADRIGMSQPLRHPFRWSGSLWVCTSIHSSESGFSAEAYRLTPLAMFAGDATTYTKKTCDGDTARNDPLGFYHGIAVQVRGADHVLTGPPHRFVAGAAVQPNLFTSLDHHQKAPTR